MDLYASAHVAVNDGVQLAVLRVDILLDGAGMKDPSSTEVFASAQRL